jgi:hypothetical protein
MAFGVHLKAILFINKLKRVTYPKPYAYLTNKIQEII